MAETLRKILGDNLDRLMASSVSLGSAPLVEAATGEHGMKIGKSTIARIRNAETPINLDYVEVLARVFGLEPWQLLVHEMNPKNLPTLANIGSAQAPLLAGIAALARQVVALDKGVQHRADDSPQPDTYLRGGMAEFSGKTVNKGPARKNRRPRK